MSLIRKSAKENLFNNLSTFQLNKLTIFDHKSSYINQVQMRVAFIDLEAMAKQRRQKILKFKSSKVNLYADRPTLSSY